METHFTGLWVISLGLKEDIIYKDERRAQSESFGSPAPPFNIQVFLCPLIHGPTALTILSPTQYAAAPRTSFFPLAIVLYILPT